MRTGQLRNLAGIFGALLLSQGASAATPISDDPASGFTLAYDDGLTFWGVPSLSNNVISFPNLSFDAGTSTTPGGSGAGATIRLTLTAKNPGTQPVGFDWLESGIYGLAESDSSATNQITATVTLQLFEIASDVEIGAPVSSTFDLDTIQTNIVDTWSLSTSLNGFGALPQVDIEITNELLSAVTSGPNLLFSKTYAGLEVSLVPLPPAAILFAGALAALVGFSRRRLASETQ